jgi:hypothetical protein
MGMNMCWRAASNIRVRASMQVGAGLIPVEVVCAGACVHIRRHACVFLNFRVALVNWDLLATSCMHVLLWLKHMPGRLGALSMLVGVCTHVHVCTRGCACMRECVLLMTRVMRADWHLLATTRVRVGVALASGHAEVSRSIACACWRSCVRARLAGRACVRAFCLMIRVVRASWPLQATTRVHVAVGVVLCLAEVCRSISYASLSLRMRVSVHAWLGVHA